MAANELPNTRSHAQQKRMTIKFKCLNKEPQPVSGKMVGGIIQIQPSHKKIKTQYLLQSMRPRSLNQLKKETRFKSDKQNTATFKKRKLIEEALATFRQKMILQIIPG
jgi:hypothetical protein